MNGGRKVFQRVKNAIKRSYLAVPYILAVGSIRGGGSQSNEAEILGGLVNELDVPNNFIEFGFSGWEFNCSGLASLQGWKGLLLDADPYNRMIIEWCYGGNIEARQLWITLESLDEVLIWASNQPVGVLSIDVDGNDYWFLKHLIRLRPAVVVVEINVCFGLRAISVPYRDDFDRRLMHESLQYYGA